MDTAITLLNLEVADPAASQHFYEAALGVGSQVRGRTADTPATGFRGFTISLVVGQPSTVDSLVETSLAGGAKTLKAAAKGLWGYGGGGGEGGGGGWWRRNGDNEHT